MTEATPTLQQLTDRLIEFRDEREWRQFHSLKNLILSLNLEDLSEAAAEKITKNAIKYPAEKSRGKSTKYTRL